VREDSLLDKRFPDKGTTAVVHKELNNEPEQQV